MPMTPLTIVSADSHAGALPEAYRDHLDPQYRDSYEGIVEDHNTFINMFQDIMLSPHRTPEVLAITDRDKRIQGGGETGAYDIETRLAEMDREGIAAEVVFPGTQLGVPPLCTHSSRRVSVELRAAGARAYHRWLGEFMASSGGRLFGIAESGPCVDMGETVRDLEWIAEHGFVAVQVPGTLKDTSLPPLFDPYYEPFWAACADLDLVLSVHIGHGLPQGAFQDMLKAALHRQDSTKKAKKPQTSPSGGNDGTGMVGVGDKLGMVGVGWMAALPAQTFLSLLLGGVFDRHPTLRLVATEVRVDWAPETLRILDERHASGELPTERPPSEYYFEHCGTGGFFPRWVLAQRDEIGLNNILFGRDYPHVEGTWPNTVDYLRALFTDIDITEADARRVLGGNAIDLYGLDGAKLDEIAARIGPETADIFGGHKVDSTLLSSWSNGNFEGPARPLEYDFVAQRLDEDLAEYHAAANR